MVIVVTIVLLLLLLLLDTQRGYIAVRDRSHVKTRVAGSWCMHAWSVAGYQGLRQSIAFLCSKTSQKTKQKANSAYPSKIMSAAKSDCCDGPGMTRNTHRFHRKNEILGCVLGNSSQLARELPGVAHHWTKHSHFCK